jgi:hypothetical protein
MLKGTKEYYRNILKRTLDSLDNKTILSIDDLAKNHGKLSEDDLITYFMPKESASLLDPANYQAHYGQASRLQDFILIGYPEYALNSLICSGYLVSRRRAIVPGDEEILFSALEKIEEKYGHRKVASLKRRLDLG